MEICYEEVMPNADIDDGYAERATKAFPNG